MKCKECGGVCDLKPGDEIKPGFIIADTYTNVDVCRACMSKGWSEATPEDFMKDSAFDVVYKSPIQPMDL